MSQDRPQVSAPLFASAAPRTQQQSAQDIDLNDVFADCFVNEWELLNNATAAASAAGVPAPTASSGVSAAAAVAAQAAQRSPGAPQRTSGPAAVSLGVPGSVVGRPLAAGAGGGAGGGGGAPPGAPPPEFHRAPPPQHDEPPPPRHDEPPPPRHSDEPPPPRQHEPPPSQPARQQQHHHHQQPPHEPPPPRQPEPPPQRGSPPQDYGGYSDGGGYPAGPSGAPPPAAAASSYASYDRGDYDRDGGSAAAKKRRKRAEPKELTEQQRVERRERNREHAKRSRIRKKFVLESLLEHVADLRGENTALRSEIRHHLPERANSILHDCITEESALLVPDSPSSGGASSMSSAVATIPRAIKEEARQLVEPDYRLMMALQSAQQNFAVSDPSLPDNPIVYASQGFLRLTGYSMDQVLGRNCRFLQGPGTDQTVVDIIRRGVMEGVDTSVCLLNYKANGDPFWNQFFVAALRDADGAIVNYVGVQCEVNQVPLDVIKERAKRMALLDS